MQCRSCGIELPEGAVHYCPKCGAATKYVVPEPGISSSGTSGLTIASSSNAGEQHYPSTGYGSAPSATMLQERYEPGNTSGTPPRVPPVSYSTFAEMVIQALVENVRKEHDAGQYVAAEQDASKGINGITQAKAEGRFAPALLKLYALRAHSRYMLASNNPDARQRAQEDVENALTSLNVCGDTVAPEVASRLGDDIRSLISEDAIARRASLEAVFNEVMPVLAVTSPQLSASVVASAPSSQRRVVINGRMLTLLGGLIFLIIVVSIGFLFSPDVAGITLGVIIGIFSLLFPPWVAIHAWRKNFKAMALAIYITLLWPITPISLLLALIAFFVTKPYHPNLNAEPKLWCLWGTGTSFYGASDRQLDGSFVTTEWFSIFYIPLIPIQSYRVIRGEHRSKWQGVIITKTTLFSILEKLPLNIKHVLKAYGFIVASIILGIIVAPLLASSNGVTGLYFVANIILGYMLLRPR